RLDPHALDEPRRGLAHLVAEDPRKVPRTHVCPRGEVPDREVARRVLGDPRLEVAERPAFGRLELQGRAELRLPPCAAHEHEEVRAIRGAASWPSSSSTRARAMPAVTPADV